MLLMSLMKRVARKHGFRVLLHEKPFAGVNGSGKHNNWSLSTDTGILLHGAGKTAEDNLRFVVFIVETLMGVYRHNGLLKASIMSATNAHRLGAGRIETLVYEEVFLFPAEIGGNFLYVGIKIAAYLGSSLAHGVERAQQIGRAHV